MAEPDKESPVELTIRDRFPGHADTELRIALLRVHHAGERAQWALDTLGRNLGDYINDPEPAYTGTLLEGSVEDLSKKLISLAAELRKSSARLLELSRDRFTREG